LAGTSKGTSIANLAHFLRESYRRGWTPESLVDKMRPRKAVYDQKQPYSDKEVNLILDAAGKINGGTTGYAKPAGTFRLLIELMLEMPARERRRKVRPGALREIEISLDLLVSSAQGEKERGSKADRHLPDGEAERENR
jgi:hypothetical protein